MKGYTKKDGGFWLAALYTSGTTSNAATIWPSWNNSITCASNANTDPWSPWNQQLITFATGTTKEATFTFSNPWPAWALGQHESEAQRALREQRDRERVAQWELEKRIVTEAKEKAVKLLVENLSERQRTEYTERGYFTVHSNKGKEYRVYKRNSHGNVVLVQQGKEIESYCIQPANVPDGDAHLAQKLMLECDEDTFLRVANKTRLAA